MPTAEVVRFLNKMFITFDSLADKHDVYKARSAEPPQERNFQ